ncbi:MAG: CDP-alcohol phosphatidyltransferase family protein [Patescibacteria group bacterium]|nr:CDP-alcohol phosphatidyltransferase family protein [Patescibacteria group bacterium]MDD5715673.1 CDP-alcohol phosphatidyltransferase family protein [Patescibacteria group bacterium]
MDDTTVSKTFLGTIIDKRDAIFTSLVKRLPASMTPNAITIARICLLIPIYIAYRYHAYTAVLVLFAISLVSDALDGAQARFRNQVTTLGKLLDPAADKIIFVGVLLMVAPHRLSTAAIITILSLEILLVLFATVFGPLAVHLFKTPRKVGANIGGKIKMSLEGASVILLLCGLSSEWVWMIAEVVMWLAAGFALFSMYLHVTTKETNRTTAAPHSSENNTTA